MVQENSLNRQKITTSKQTTQSKKSGGTKKILSTSPEKIKKRKEYERDKKRQQREKMRSDPDKYQKYLQQRKKEYQNAKRTGSRRPISELNKKEKKNQREKWRKEQRHHRDQKKKEQQNSRNETLKPEKNRHKTVGEKIARKNRKSLKDEIQKLKNENEKLRRSGDKYRKRWERSGRSHVENPDDSPEPKRMVNETLRKGEKEVRRQLLTSFAVQKQIKNTYKTASSREKTAISKVVAGKIVKKYRVMKDLKNIISLDRYYNSRNKEIISEKQVRPTRSNYLKKLIFEFFCNDEITVQSPNKKDFVTFKKQKELKRFLTDTLPNLHQRLKKNAASNFL